MKTVFSVIVCFAIACAVDAAPSKVIRHSRGVPDTYVVVLDERVLPASVNGIARSLAAAYKVRVQSVWSSAPRGFLATGPDVNFTAMSDDPRVKYVEQDAVLEPPTSRVSAMYAWSSAKTARKWHLDRIDDVSWTEQDNTYLMCPEGGDVTAYVIDRGVYLHQEFEVPGGYRVTSLNFVCHEVPEGQPFPAVDEANGCVNDATSAHGTQVASLLAGDTLGASHANIVSLRVHSCGRSGTSLTSDVLNAINWLAARPASTLGVVNWSGFTPPGDEQFAAVADAARQMVIATNMPFITAAGNYSTDACKFSPQSRGYNPVSRTTGELLVVGATGIGPNGIDRRWQNHDANGNPVGGEYSGSNAGDCVGIYAPGQDVTFALNNASMSAPQFGVGTGTSYASPIVAGVAARYVSSYFSRYGTKPTHTQVYEFLTTNSYASVNRANSYLPTWWACFRIGMSGNANVFQWDYDPGQCDLSTDKGPYKFEVPTSPAPYSARMLYWDPSANAGPGWYCEGDWTDW